MVLSLTWRTDRNLLISGTSFKGPIFCFAGRVDFTTNCFPKLRIILLYNKIGKFDRHRTRPKTNFKYTNIWKPRYEKNVCSLQPQHCLRNNHEQIDFNFHIGEKSATAIESNKSKLTSHSRISFWNISFWKFDEHCCCKEWSFRADMSIRTFIRLIPSTVFWVASSSLFCELIFNKLLRNCLYET